MEFTLRSSISCVRFQFGMPVMGMFFSAKYITTTPQVGVVNDTGDILFARGYVTPRSGTPI